MPSPSATWPGARRSSAGTCSASTHARGCTASARSSSRGGSGGSPHRALCTDWDFAARNLRSARWLHKRIDVDFNGWFMCLIPRQVLDEIGLSLPLFIKWDDAEFGLRAKARRLPHGDLPGCRRVAHPVDRQERRTGLAGLLPPPQPVRRCAAALAVPQGRADDPGEPEPPDQAPGLDAVLHRRAAAPGTRGRARRSRRPARRAAGEARQGPRVRQAVHRRPARDRPRRLPAGQAQEATAQGHGLHGDPESAVPAGHGGARPDPPAPAARAPSRGSSPRPRSPPWTPSGSASRATTPRSSR